MRLDPIIEISNLEDECSEKEDIVLLRQFIKELRELDKALILLHLEGLTSKEIAGIMDVSQTNVTTKIYRIKKILKNKFKNYKNI